MLQREEALKKSEQMLEEDALRFDAFLKENDEKVQEAIKKAEVEAKAKQDKVSLHSHQPWLSTTEDQHYSGPALQLQRMPSWHCMQSHQCMPWH